MKNISVLRVCGLLPLISILCSAGTSRAENGDGADKRPNILFVAVDDLNDFAGYASEEAGNFLQTIYPDAAIRKQVVSRLTPNLDKLAVRSAPFLRTYCPSALCGPSRTSLMTGTYPHQTEYYRHDRHFRTYATLKKVVTLPQHLKQNGYYTTGLGKIFHKGKGNANGPLKDDWADARHSWNQWVNHPAGCNGGQPAKYSPPDGGLLQFGPSRLNLEESGDWLTADLCARLLQYGTAETVSKNRNGRSQTITLPGDKPFFLGCGLFRPHLPFYAPKKFFDLFPTDEMSGLNSDALQAIVDDLKDLPTGADRFSDFTEGKMKVLLDNAIRVGGDNDASKIVAWRSVVQSYLACVCFADACVGRIVDGLDASPECDNTVLVLWSDHGYHLGSKYHIAKQALWEEANRTVLIIRDPRRPTSCDGRPRRQIASLSDLYPTICSLAEVETPAHVVGEDLSPLLHTADGAEIHDAVLMTYMKGNHSIRTPTHRFMRYADSTTELYDIAADPKQQTNLAGKKEVAAIQEQLEATLEQKLKGDVQTNGITARTPPSIDNNPLKTNGHNFYGADPSVVVADDGRLFLFPTTDNRDWEKQSGWSCYSTTDLQHWTDHGVIFSNEDSNWGENKAWAPDIIKRDGKYYFYYYFNNGGGGKGGVGVAVADKPEGPFKEITEERLCTGHDPAVFGDDDGRCWLYLQDIVYELGDDMASFKSGPINLNLDYRPPKFEAAYVFKRNGLYYFTIARDWNNLIYYTGNSPTGPFEFRGEFMKPYGGNNHHSIVKYNNRWMIFYHEWVKNDPVHQRQPRAEYLNFNEDGTIQMVEPTDLGVSVVQAAKLQLRDRERHRQTVCATAHDKAFQILDEKVRDPFITRCPDGKFYLTGTTAGTHWGDTVGVRLWKSDNLIDWEDLGFVWDLNKDGKQQNSWHFDRPAKEGVKNGRSIWAPEIHFLNGTWWIPHSVNVAGHGLLKSMSGKPEGPYFALPAIADRGIDPHLIQEEDGKTYYLWGYDNIVGMKDDLSGTAENPKRIAPAGKHPLGYEGILIKKIGDKYLLIASGRYGYELSDTYDLYFCVAESLYGPYGPRRMAVKNAGHGNIFQDNDRRWWCTAFDHEFVQSKNRWTPWIVPIDIVEIDDNIIIEVKDNRFRPTAADQRQVKQLNETGVSSGREGKKPWEK